MESGSEEKIIKKASDKYRSFLHDETKEISWRHGGPPSYVMANKLFEQDRTKVYLYLYIYI